MATRVGSSSSQGSHWLRNKDFSSSLSCAQLHSPFVLSLLSKSTPNLGRGRSNSAFQGGPRVGGQRAAKGQEKREVRQGADPYLAVALRLDPKSLESPGDSGIRLIGSEDRLPDSQRPDRDLFNSPLSLSLFHLSDFGSSMGQGGTSPKWHASPPPPLSVCPLSVPQPSPPPTFS